MKHLCAVICLVLAGACSGGGSPTTPGSPNTPGTPSPGTGGSTVTWSWTGTEWRASGTAPACPTPTNLRTPVNLDLVTSVLYPGQVRGEYKAHGGFRFDLPGQTADLSIVAPMSGYLLRGSKYLVSGEVQYSIDWVNSCGIMHRFGHLRELSPRFAALAAALPQNAEGDSRTTNFPSGQFVDAGELIGTATGLRNTSNVFLDWGMYDLRQRNASSADPAWFALHNNDTHAYGVCWFTHLTPQDEARVRALPPADGLMGRTSDYCR